MIYAIQIVSQATLSYLWFLWEMDREVGPRFRFISERKSHCYELTPPSWKGIATNHADRHDGHADGGNSGRGFRSFAGEVVSCDRRCGNVGVYAGDEKKGCSRHRRVASSPVANLVREG